MLAKCMLQRGGTRSDMQDMKTRALTWLERAYIRPRRKRIGAAESSLVAEAYGAACSRVCTQFSSPIVASILGA